MSARVVLLCEDRQTNSFVRRFLSCRGFSHHDVTTLPFPHGTQSGEQWVRERYPRELRAIRARQKAFLVVVVDADNRSIKDRRSELDRECARQGVPGRTSEDPVIVAVPRRNIETWLAWLGGDKVDEETTYPRLGHESDCGPLAKNLYRMCHEAQRLDESAPPSLIEACREYRRLGR